LLTKNGCASRECAKLAGNHRGGSAGVHILGDKPARDGGQLRPSAAERVDVCRLVNLVAERDRASGPESQEIARGERTDEPSGFVHHAKVTHIETAHATDRTVDECIGRHRGKRTARKVADTPFECVRSAF
jgi:hypothetical protein